MAFHSLQKLGMEMTSPGSEKSKTPQLKQKYPTVECIPELKRATSQQAFPSSMLSNNSCLEVQQRGEDQPSYSLHFLLHRASRLCSPAADRGSPIGLGDKGMLQIFTRLLFWLLPPPCYASFLFNTTDAT